jgi:ATP-dependent exoDNAse (exonuclease V) alpha subunit
MNRVRPTQRQPARASSISQEALPAGYADSDVARRTLELMRGDETLLSISGRAGTGKTTLIRYLMQADRETPTVLLAPTGIAAINVGGQTIHSFFGFPPRILDQATVSDRYPTRVMKEVKRIIVDEISMVRCDVLDAMDFRLRQAKRSAKPFGGVQLIFVGDYFQLPPVIPSAESEVLESMGYENGFAFSARVMAAAEPAHLRLETIHRQSEEAFIDLLGGVRVDPADARAVRELNENCHRPHREGAIPIILTTTNARAEQYNVRRLEALPGSMREYTGAAEGSYDLSREKPPAPVGLALKPGARVMALKNDADRRWVNGSLGVVTGMGASSVRVLFDGADEAVEVGPSGWEKVRYDWDQGADKVVSLVAGKYTQIPLTLAWAVTIHKAQGLSFDDVRVDMGRAAFAPGQAYVALSRARTLDGLSLARPLAVTDFFVDPAVARYDSHVEQVAEYL